MCSGRLHPASIGKEEDDRVAGVNREPVEAGERFIDALPEHEFAIPRQLVADAAVIGALHTALPEPRLEVEVQLLLLDEA